MRRGGNILCAAVIGLLGVEAAASDLPPLREVARIDNGLLTLAIASEMQERCPDVAPRLIRAFLTLRNLRATARDMGYSAAEIEAFVASDVEKARLRRRGTAWLEARGVDSRSDEDLCRLAQSEIRNETPVGRYLR